MKQPVNLFNCAKLIGCDQDLIDIVYTIANHYYPKSVFINSGFRSPEDNLKCGGATNSQHVLGKAADIEVDEVSCIKVAAWVLTMFDKVNGYGLDVYKNYLHLDTRETNSKVYWVYDRKGKAI